MQTDEGRYDRDEASRRRGDEVPRIAPLSDLDDFQVADGCPDVRGWDVVGAAGHKLGTVHDLIADTGTMSVRYLDVALDRSAAGPQNDHDVLVPIGRARVDENDDRVILDADTASRIATLPAYAHGEITREEENRLLPALGLTAVESDAEFYSAPYFDDRQFYGGRRAPQGDRERSLTRARE